MAILDVAKKVALKVGIAVQTQLFAATDRDSVLMAALLNETADDIAGVYDWQVLRKVATLTGDGVAVGFDLPTDYGRMLTTATLWSSRYLGGMAHIVSSDQWLEMLTLPYTMTNGAWTIYGGQLHILAAMATDDTAKFFYMSNLLVHPSTGDDQAKFSKDTDTYRLSEKLLGLGTIVKWKSQKGQDFSDDLALYNIELANAINRDGGSKPRLDGQRGASLRGVPEAWPGTVRAVS